MSNPKDVLLFAAINCSHHIEGEKITLGFYPGKPGNNALDQLSARLEVAFDACTASVTARIAELESQLAAETARLDFVLNEELVIYEFKQKFQLHDVMGGTPFPSRFETPRAAIDAAIEFSKGGK